MILHTLIILTIIYLAKDNLYLSLIIFCIYFGSFTIIEKFEESEIPKILHISRDSIKKIREIGKEKKIINQSLSDQLTLVDNYIKQYGDIKITKDKFDEIKEFVKQQSKDNVDNKIEQYFIDNNL